MKRPEMIWIRKKDANSETGVWSSRAYSTAPFKGTDIPYTPHNPAREAAVREVVEAAEQARDALVHPLDGSKVAAESASYARLCAALAKLATLDGEEVV